MIYYSYKRSLYSLGMFVRSQRIEMLAGSILSCLSLCQRNLSDLKIFSLIYAKKVENKCIKNDFAMDIISD